MDAGPDASQVRRRRRSLIRAVLPIPLPRRYYMIRVIGFPVTGVTSCNLHRKSRCLLQEIITQFICPCTSTTAASAPVTRTVSVCSDLLELSIVDSIVFPLAERVGAT